MYGCLRFVCSCGGPLEGLFGRVLFCFRGAKPILPRFMSKMGYTHVRKLNTTVSIHFFDCQRVIVLHLVPNTHDCINSGTVDSSISKCFLSESSVSQTDLNIWIAPRHSPLKSSSSGERMKLEFTPVINTTTNYYRIAHLSRSIVHSFPLAPHEKVILGNSSTFELQGKT